MGELPHPSSLSLQDILQEEDQEDEFLQDLTRLQSSSSSSPPDGEGEPWDISTLTVNSVSNDSIISGVPVVQCQELRQISEQLQQKEVKLKIGVPLVVAVCGSLLAVGTSHGVVLLFARQQQDWKGLLGGAEQHGAVTALDVSEHNQWLLAGHTDGHILLWDVASKKLIKTVKHHVSPVLHLRFIGDGSRFVSADVKGVMNLFSVSRYIVYVVEPQLILDGTAGKLYSVQPLQPRGGRNGTQSPVYEHFLIAFCTSKKAHVMALYHKSVKIVHKMLRPKSVQDGLWVPCVNWCTSFDPILAVSWGPYIELVEVKMNSSKNSLVFSSLAHFELDSAVTNLSWLGQRSLMAQTVKDELITLDPNSGEQLGVISGSSMEIVYHSRLSTSVSDPKYCFSGSFYLFGDGVYVLGMKKVYFMYLLSWEERVQDLLSQNKFLQGLALCRKFYQGSILGIGLPLDSNLRKEQLSNKILEILVQFFQFVSRSKSSVDTKSIVSSYQSVGIASVEFCLMISREDFLFSEVFERFRAIGQEGFFFELLEPFILNNMLSYLAPEVMQLFVEHYRAKKMLLRVERCITHLDIANLDFHQVITLCRSNNLFNALIYMYNRGLNDFATPLEELINYLKHRLNIQKDQSDLEKTIFLMFQYISSCLSTFQSRHDVLQYIFQPGNDRVQFLLMLEPKQLLDTLSICFEDSNFTDKTVSLQSMADSLLSVSESSSDSTSLKTELLLLFIGKHFARGRITVSQQCLERIVYSLCGSRNQLGFFERQQVLLQITKSLHTTSNAFQFDNDRMLLLVEGAQYFQVAAYIYRIKRQWKKVISCYLKDSELKITVFHFIKEMMRSNEISEEDKSLITSATIDHLRELITADSNATCRLIIQAFTHHHDRILHELDPYPEVQYTYLASIMNKDERQVGANSMSELLEQSGIHITPEIHELYVKLMCVYAPQSVHPYLLSQDNYPLDSCLKCCRSAGITDATVYLLERTGDVSGALSILLEAMGKQMDLLDKMKVKESNIGAFPTSEPEKAVHKTLHTCIALCQRNSQRLEDGENETLWFRLLDIIVEPLRALRTQDSSASWMHNCLTSLLGTILYSMMGYVALPAILSKIVKDHGRDEFRDFKFIILGMLDTCGYEQVILQTANHLVEQDMFSATLQLYKGRSKGFRPKASRCAVCDRTVFASQGYQGGDTKNPLVIFHCGHVIHSACFAQKLKFCPLCCKGKQRTGGISPSSETNAVM